MRYCLKNVYVIVYIHAMNLVETALSFLGIGLQPPVIRWGALLQRAQNFQTVALYPWVFLSSVFAVVSVLAFNVVDDGLRDAADPRLIRR